SVGRLEIIGVIRAAAGVCKIRNQIYLRALRGYFGMVVRIPASLKSWLQRLLPLVGVLLIIASLPTAYVYVNDVVFAPPAIHHTVDLHKPGVDVAVTHPTVIKDLVDTSLTIELTRVAPMAALTVTIATSDPEITLRDKTRFVVMRGDDERKDFTV